MHAICTHRVQFILLWATEFFSGYIVLILRSTCWERLNHSKFPLVSFEIIHFVLLFVFEKRLLVPYSSAKRTTKQNGVCLIKDHH